MHISFAGILLSSLLFFSVFSSKTRIAFRNRKKDDWVIDGISLVCYFFLIPLVQAALVYKLYSLFLPQLKNRISLGWEASFILILAIDYLWYWNHRLFHAQTPLWNMHVVHHESTELDFFASQRNSILSFPLMIYFWIVPLALFQTKNPAPFLALSAIGALVNFWGHTRLALQPSPLKRLLACAFIQPEDHFWHHSAENPNCNFSTIFNFWDKLHGTWHQPGNFPSQLGSESGLPLWRKIFFPVRNIHG